MLKVFCGNDENVVREKAMAFVNEQIQGGYTVTRYNAEDFETGVVTNALGATSLFGGKELFVFDTPSADSEFEEAVKAGLKEMGESENLFVVIEGALLAAPKKTYAKHADSVEEYKTTAPERFNTFAMADALSARDKKKLWLLLQEAKQAGLAAEEIIGVLWWQLKSLRLAALTNSASEAGLKDFPYNKAKRALSKFKDGELEAMSEKLLGVYHDGHGGIKDIDMALERFVLTL